MAPFREMEMRDSLKAPQLATLCSPQVQTNEDLLVPRLGTWQTEHVMTQAKSSQMKRKEVHLKSAKLECRAPALHA